MFFKGAFLNYSFSDRVNMAPLFDGSSGNLVASSRMVSFANIASPQMDRKKGTAEIQQDAYCYVVMVLPGCQTH